MELLGRQTLPVRESGVLRRVGRLGAGGLAGWVDDGGRKSNQMLAVVDLRGESLGSFIAAFFQLFNMFEHFHDEKWGN